MEAKQDLLNDEKEFIHDLCGPLSVAVIYIDGILENSNQSPQNMSESLTNLGKIMKALEEMESLMIARRVALGQKRETV